MIEKLGISVQVSEPEISRFKDSMSVKQKFLVQVLSTEDKAIVDTVVKFARKHGYNKALLICESSVREMLKKQIPQEPLVMLGTDILVCRFCKSELAKYDGRHTYPHCQWCGQKIKNMEDEWYDTST